MDLGLTDEIAIVTGGASGIGLAIAECFLAEGARVAIWDIAANTPEVAAELGAAVLGIVVDVTQPDSIAAALDRTLQYFGGPVDHVVHSAAVASGKFGFPFTNLAPADWPRVLQVNVIGMVNIAHALSPAMINRKKGTFTFIGSVAGQIGSQTDPPYSASKAAGINFAQCMAKDLAPHGVRVNTVCPGMVKTPLNRGIWQAWHSAQPPEARLDFDEWASEKIRKVVPLGSWQTPEDVANMAVFLASPRASQTTGQTINVDGGFVMHW